nr:Chain 3, TRP-ARG-SER-TYR-TYR-ALA [Saccharomyces cerevisiae]5NIF_4 Chain 4, TRP-ARG-SER-TYR-TYR-ALA [Saccharomyces cerevisiae]
KYFTGSKLWRSYYA